MKARASIVLATLGLAAAAVVVPVSAAQAAPSNCSPSYSGRYGYGKCTSGSGKYQISVQCDKSWAPDYIRDGNWVSVGSTSTATCNSGDNAKNGKFVFASGI